MEIPPGFCLLLRVKGTSSSASEASTIAVFFFFFPSSRDSAVLFLEATESLGRGWEGRAASPTPDALSEGFSAENLGRGGTKK
uniref:Uncharacterized protein n=1 Tax=Arundo donax TaxID=35708 RepID=A0A0A9DM95_ARUDO